MQYLYDVFYYSARKLSHTWSCGENKGGEVVSAKNLNITNQRNPKNTKTESSTTISKNITSPPNLRCVVCLVVLINNKCSFVYFHELKVKPVSTIPDLNIDTRETLGLFVALF